MVRNIVSIIEGNTDETSMPREEPVFSHYLFRESNNIGFGEAKRKLEQYANLYNRGVIPNYLNCIAKVGGAETIRGQYLQTSSNSSHYNNNSTHFGGAYLPTSHINRSNVSRSDYYQTRN